MLSTCRAATNRVRARYGFRHVHTTADCQHTPANDQPTKVIKKIQPPKPVFHDSFETTRMNIICTSIWNLQTSPPGYVCAVCLTLRSISPTVIALGRKAQSSMRTNSFASTSPKNPISMTFLILLSVMSGRNLTSDLVKNWDLNRLKMLFSNKSLILHLPVEPANIICKVQGQYMSIE